MDYSKESLRIHGEKSVLRVLPNVSLKSRSDLSTNYTPGIAAVSKKIAEDKSEVFRYTSKRNSVAVVTDGSAVLGLGNIGPEAALPVMEGKAILFSKFAGIDAIPICLDTQNSEEIIKTVKNIAPTFGGINLEDISAPRCFEIEAALQDIGIPVMHDDQHGTAVVVLAGLINALKVVGKSIENVKIVVSGAGAAGTAVAKIIQLYSKEKVRMIVMDSKGALCHLREDMDWNKTELQKITKNMACGHLENMIIGADVFIGVSAPKILTKQMVASMAEKPIIFALANPIPEIDYIEAKEAGATVVATGRSDWPNQINNVLAFPGIFRGALNAGATRITENMLLAAANALASHVERPNASRIIPSALDDINMCLVASAVMSAAKKDGVDIIKKKRVCPPVQAGQFKRCKLANCPLNS
ncbi:MAG TPA: NADP-dependent malic enzyme [bacterium]|nr:NADP-dependent malic enzyme [bacterium]